MSLTDPSKRLEAIPPYMFAELERKVADKRKAGIDVISLGIGDPDMPTFPHVVEAMQAGKHVISEKPVAGFFGREGDKAPNGKIVPKALM